MESISRRRRRARRFRALALALAIGALAGPAAASADPLGTDGSPLNSLNPPMSQSDGLEGTHDADSGYSSVNATVGPSPGETRPVPALPASTGGGFDWASAAIGATAAMAFAALGGAALLTVRRRTAVSPSPSAS